MKVVATLSLGLMAFSAQQQDQFQVNQPEILITTSTIDPLTNSTVLALNGSQALRLDPGVRMNRIEGGIVLSTFDGHKIELNTGSEIFSLFSPATVRVGSAEWSFGTGTNYSTSLVSARRKQQDDADQNLKSMQEAARKLKSQQNNKPQTKQPGRWANQENPFATAELFNKPAIQQLTHLSAAGF